MASDVEPVVGPNANIPGIPGASAPIILYTVQDGDNLASISELFYGNESQWPRIWNANRGQHGPLAGYLSPHPIMPGIVLSIPTF